MFAGCFHVRYGNGGGKHGTRAASCGSADGDFRDLSMYQMLPYLIAAAVSGAAFLKVASLLRINGCLLVPQPRFVVTNDMISQRINEGLYSASFPRALEISRGHRYGGRPGRRYVL